MHTSRKDCDAAWLELWVIAIPPNSPKHAKRVISCHASIESSNRVQNEKRLFASTLLEYTFRQYSYNIIDVFPDREDQAGDDD